LIRILSSLVLFVLALPGAIAQAPVRVEDPLIGRKDPIPPIVRLAVRQSRDLKFVGRRSVELRRDGKMLRFTEIVTRLGQRTRTEFSEDSPFSGQIIVEDAQNRRHFLPDSNEVRVLPARAEDGVPGIIKAYKSGTKMSFRMGRPELIAGRRAPRLDVRDPDGNVLQQFWIDPQSGAVLQRKVYDSVGTYVGGFRFESVDFKAAIDPGIFVLMRKGAKLTTPEMTLDEMIQQGGFAAVTLKGAPGFRLDNVRVISPVGAPVLLQAYVGSGRRVILFQTKADLDPERMKRFARAGTRTVVWTAQGRNFALVGPSKGTDLESLAEYAKKR